MKELELNLKRMKEESIDILKKSIVSTYKKYGDKNVLLYKGKRTFTGNDIAIEIENETEMGIHMIDILIKLSIDLIERDKINIS